MTASESDSSNQMRSLERALDVLRVVSESRQPVRLSDVSRAAGLHLATSRRILKVLERRAYVSSEGGGYVAGPAALLPAHGYLVGNGLTRAALPVLQELADALQLTSSLSVRVEDVRVMVARVEGARPLRYQLPVGERLPLHLGAGKVFAAWMEDAELTAMLERVAPIRRSDGREVTAEEFRSELAGIRARGYATSQNERVVGAASVCAPVLHEGELRGALQVAGRADDVSEDILPSIVEEVCRAALSISRRLP